MGEGRGTISDLGNAHKAYFSMRHQHTRLSDDVTWVAATAVAACCQRQMETAGFVTQNKYVPSLLDVAKESQAMTGRCTAISEDERREDRCSAAARRARWLEAKWQLLYLIQSLPFPDEDTYSKR
jgi:L-asparaginase II